VKGKLALSIIILALVLDQGLKLYTKMNYPTGEMMRVMGFDWFRLHFIENSGMAWGLSLGQTGGKLALTIFRLVAVIVFCWYLVKFTRGNYSRGFIICISLILAGAMGNLIDSMFYGLLFDKGLHYDALTKSMEYYDGIAKLNGQGYAPFLQGSVVDMLYFPMVRGHYPSWFPFIGGQAFEFFSPIFNIADACISAGIITFILFQKRLLRKPKVDAPATIVTNATDTDSQEIS